MVTMSSPVEVDRRQTITVWNQCWSKYSKLKQHHLREYGRPELSFTEFANASIISSNLTLSHLLEIRRQLLKVKLQKKIDELSEKGHESKPTD